MKSSSLTTFLLILTMGFFADAQAQESATSAQPASDTELLLQAIEATKPYPATATPKTGTFYTVQNGENWPPLPGNLMDLPFWDLGNGFYLLDDRAINYVELRAETAAAEETESNYTAMNRSMNSLSSSGGVYLTNSVATLLTNQTVTETFDIAGGTNFVPYDIWMTTNLSNQITQSQWTWLGIGYTSNSYTFTNQPLDMAFYTLSKPQRTMVAGWGNDSVSQCTVPFGLTNAIAVAGGGGQSLALLNDGTVRAWGQNSYGQGSVPTNAVGVAMVASGWYHNVALLTNGTVVAWGLNGSSFTPPWNLTNVPTSLTNVTVVSAQALHSLALCSDGTVVGWGNNGNGETNVPSGLSNVVAIAAGYQFNLAVKTDGTVTAWGNNNSGQCTVPTALSNVVDVAAGSYHSLALLENGTVVAWGDNSHNATNVPAGLTNVVAIAASGDPQNGTAYSVALKSDGTVVAWGDSEVLNPVVGLSNVIAIGAGADHALAVRSGPPTPVITLQPKDEYQIQGSNATFRARGAGLYSVYYQWQFNGVNLSGATNATLSLTNVQSAQLGSYDVIVSNEVGSIVSSNATLYLVTPPVIVSRSLPTITNVTYQSNLLLNVAAYAPGQNDGFPLSYQWQFNGANLFGGNATTYTIHANANSSGTYSVLVSNAAGSTNAVWQVAVLGTNGLQFVQQPTNQYQIAGGNVTFVSGAVSSNSITYQWQFGGTNIAGATNAALTLTNVQTAHEGVYDVIASDLATNLTSSNANFALVAAPLINSQTLPTNISVIFYTNLTLSVAASAPGQTSGFPLYYQWQFNGTNLIGKTSSSYTLFGETNSVGSYSVIVTNAAGGASASWQVTMTYVGSYIDVGTLAYHLSTNAVGRTNGYAGNSTDMLFLSNWTSATYTNANIALLTNATWSTNCWLKGVPGLSATCIGISNNVGSRHLLTMVSPRHYLRAKHTDTPPGIIYFLDTNNVLYARTSVEQVNIGTNAFDINIKDTSVGILNADLPASVGYLPVLPTNFATYLPTNGGYVQGIGMNQDMKIFGQPMRFDDPLYIFWSSGATAPFGLTTNWNVAIRDGDSSAPERLLIGDQLVLVAQHFTSTYGVNLSLKIDAINQKMHYLSTNNPVGTNDYQLTPLPLTNWPSIH